MTTGLTGGSGGAPIEGDLVVVTVSIGTAARAPTTAISTPAGYTALTAQRTTATTYDTNVQTCYKIMTSTPDTAVTIPASGNNADGISYVIQVFRGVDPTTPMDATPTYATGSGVDSRPDPAAITPVTAGAWIVCCGGGAAATGAVYTAGYLTNLLTFNGPDTNDGTVGSGYYTGWTSGAYDPAVFGGGSVNAANSWGATTLALRPLVLVERTGNLDATEAGDDTFAASGTVDPFPAMLVDDVEKFDFVGGPNPTISGISFGTPASDRIVVVFFQCAATPSAVAIGGVSATFVANLSGSDYYGIAWAAVPSSSSGSLVLTGGGGYGLFSGAFAVYGEGLPALDFAFVSGATSSDIDLTGGGVVVGAAITTGAISWTGVTEQAEYVGLTGSNTSLALNYDTTYGAPATIQTSPAAITRLLSFGTALAEIVGTLSATETGSDTAAGSGDVVVQGDAAATETGSDSFAADGAVEITGSSAVQEAGSDTFAGSGSIPATLTMAVQEAGSDALAGSGVANVAGSLVVQEAGLDTWSGSGVLAISGAITVQEAGSDVLASSGAVTVSGAWTSQEVGSDTFTGSGSTLWPPISGAVSAQETGSDTFTGSGVLTISGTLGVGESGQDSFVASGVIPVSGNATLAETGGDTFAGSGLVRVSGATAVQETGSDTFAGSGLVLITGSMAVFQPTTDTFTGSGTVLVTVSGAATEIGSDTFTGSGQFVVAPISGQMVAVESGSDTLTASAIALIEGLLSVVESGPDAFIGEAQSREPVTYPLAGRVQSLPGAEPTFPGVAEVYPTIGDQTYPLQGAAQPFPLG